MAKRTKVQVDINDIFIPNIHDAATKSAIMKQDTWPIVVSIYALSEGALKVGPSSSSLNFINMTTIEGFAGCAVQGSADSYRVLTADCVVVGGGPDSPSCYTSRLISKNPRYIVNMLKPSSTHVVKEFVLNHVKSAKCGASELAKQGLSHLLSKLEVNKRPNLELEDNLITALGDMHFNGGKQVLGHQAAAVRWKYDEYLKKQQEYVNQIDHVNNLLTTDKWLVIPKTLGGILIGAVSRHPLLVATEHMKNHGMLKDPITAFNFADVIEPFRWYPNVESIPEHIRSEIDIARMMLNTHVNTQEYLPPVGYETKIWESLEAFAFCNWHTNGTPLYFLAK